MKTTCPDQPRLRALMDGSASPSELATLTEHLESCARCQQALEWLAAGGQDWSGAVRRLAQKPGPTDAALRAVIAELKSDPAHTDTQAEPVTHDEFVPDFLSPSEHTEYLGRLDHYEVIELLGRGGMGLVLKAYDPPLGRFVAIKVLAPQLATNPAARQRFAREARAGAAIRHDNIIAIHVVAEAKGLPYIVMEYVPGVSLQEHLEQAGPLEIEAILRIGRQVAAGLAAAHAQGLIHRDIKPANILLEGERVKITDFGLARAVNDASLTQAGILAGTPQYMAPEQARGEALDHRADLFSLGSVLYALASGQAPFRADSTLAVLRRVCEEEPQPLGELNPTIPDWFVALIDKLHAKDPAERFASASEVAERLRQHLDHLREPERVAAPPALPRRVVQAPSEAKIHPRLLGFEYRSRRTLAGWPLLHIASGFDPATGKARVARGIIAIGDRAVGGLAIGGAAFGIVALGGAAAGVVALGGGAIGLLCAIGGLAIGSIAGGGGAVGIVAIGGAAVGYYAFGGGVYGIHTMGASGADPAGVEFFRYWLGSWTDQFRQPRR